MAKEKDITEKVLEGYNDVFADILNVLLFSGKRIVQPDDLTNAQPVSQLKLDGGLHEQERDVAKYWNGNKVRIALYGAENQSSQDRDMPLRVFGYDGAAYKEQVNAHISQAHAHQPRAPVYPAVTLVLYFGPGHWKQPKSLLECIQTDIPDELRPFLQDYKIHVFEIPWLSPETVNLFQSDFRIVADFFVQQRINKAYVPSPQKMLHVDAVMKLLSAVTKDPSFDTTFQKLDVPKKEDITMCDIMQKNWNDGVREGLRKGRRDGLRKGRRDGLRKGQRDGLRKGQLKILIDLVHDGLLTLPAAVSRSGMQEADFIAAVKKAYPNFIIPS